MKYKMRLKIELLFVFYILNSLIFCSGINISFVNLPNEHLPYFFNAYPTIARECELDEGCIYKDYIGKKSCWGYERDCKEENSYPRALCPGDHRGWVKTKKAQMDTFYTQADFGYVKEQVDDTMVMCEPLFPDDTSLECSKFLRFCRGRNVMLNFTGLINRGNNLRYKMDILGPGQIGGHCKLHERRLKGEAEHMSPLQSWGPEMVNFVATNKRPIVDGLCDVVIEKPTYIMKIDATVNMYHHFCDFFNLYASLHVNSSHPTTFSKDNHILIWETFNYDSAFKETWNAFTNNPVWDLKAFRGEVVCFKNVVFPLLPRMIFGLFYNTPIIYGCERSGLFHAFSRHILSSLNIVKKKRQNDNVHVTLLSRETKYRGILNEQALLAALEKVEGYKVKRVVYDRSVPFPRQLEITHNTDVFIGMHGAGLTHLLFLPDWAAVFELYHCEDPGCYSDLTRLRGLKYVTWENKEKLKQQDQGHHPDGGSHAKFTNYAFDVDEFLRLVKVAANHVRQQKSFQEFTKQSLKRDEL